MITNIFNFYKIDCFIKKDDKDIPLCEYTASESVGTDANLFSDYDLTVTGNFKISVIIQTFNIIIQMFNIIIQMYLT